MLTRKHFEAMAEIIKEAEKAGLVKYAGSLASRFATYFAQENPQFDRERFLKACGLG